MDFFSLCKAKQRRTPFDLSSEMRFFLDNNIILRNSPNYSYLAKTGSHSTFDVVRANIVLRGLINKTFIERAYFKITQGGILKKDLSLEDREKFLQQIQKEIAELPYYEEDGQRIYVPIFVHSINSIYASDFFKFEEKPYKDLINEFEAISIDPFDTYGDELYNSLFTKLVQLKKTEEGSAYYDYDAWSIYFVNKGGRLEACLPLFDKYLRNPAPNHMIEKLIPVVNCYYENKRDLFFKTLVDNRLISSTLLVKHLGANNPIISKKS
ncbi:MAG: hypothetical protein K6B65_07090 [Bacilli bacterium]|nr:hypothetical protein [Bacilli bacterium]